MKRILCLLAITLCTVSLFASTLDSIPNGSFESWNSYSFNLPTNYSTSSNLDAYSAFSIANVTQTTDAYHGSSAVQITTLISATDTVGGWFSNATGSTNGNPTTWAGGIPYSQIPTGMRGYYKYNVTSADSALIGVVFKKNHVSYAHYFYGIGGIHNSYVPFSFTFSPALTQAPDSIIFVATSSNELKNIRLNGSTLKLDSVSFTGVAGQPPLMNGDFESWSNYSTPLLPVDWNTSQNASHTIRTTDAKDGTYALELETLTETDNGTTKASNGWATIYLITADGFPCPTQDSLIFYYKYTPAISTDSASVGINLIKNGQSIDGSFMSLGAASTYTRKALGFNSNNVIPDTITIQFQSSYWENTAVGYAGAILKVDAVKFKSQTISTGTNTVVANGSISLYPNPVKDISAIEINHDISLSNLVLYIYDATGKIIKNSIITSYTTYLNKGSFATGIYYYEIRNNNQVLKTGKFVVQ
jgi:hypothetical protein